MEKIEKHGLYANIIMPDLDADFEYMKSIYKFDNESYTYSNLCDYSSFLDVNHLYLADEVFLDFNLLDNIDKYLQLSHYIYISNKNTEKKSFRKYIRIEDNTENTYRKICNNCSKIFANDVLTNFFRYSYTINTRKNGTFKRYAFKDNYGELFLAMCKNAFKSPFKDTMITDFSDMDAFEITNRLNLENFKSEFASFSFLNTFFGEVVDVGKNHVEIAFISELMLGIRTAIYIMQEIYNLEQKNGMFNDNQLYDIFSVLIYVFIYPNIFNRKKLVDEILTNIYKWEYNPLNRFHKEISLDMADEFIDSVQSGKEGYRKQIAQAILSFTTTSLPIIRAYTYNASTKINGYKKRLEEKIKDYSVKNIIENIYDDSPEKDNIECTKYLESIKSKREKDIFCKLYRFLKMKLYNKKTMDIWQNAINLDFEENHTFKKIILSVLEYERVNLFENNVSVQYIPNTDDTLHKLYKLLKTRYTEE